MQIASLLKLLSDFADLAGSLGDRSAAQRLTDLRGLFLGHEGITLAKFVRDLNKRKPASRGSESEPVQNVRGLLSKLQGLFFDAECKSAAKDIDLLIDIFRGHDHSEIAQLVAYINSGIEQTRGHSAARTKELSSDVVSTYVNKLRSCEGQNELFDQAMQSLRVDKRARVGELREIASKYIGFEIAKKKKKADVLKAIADHQAFNARQVARGSSQP